MKSSVNKPQSVKSLFRTKGKGMRIVANYQTKASANKKVAQLRKQGYKAKWTLIMGNYEVWVSARYFRDHPRAKGYLD